jgi:hypothetical protein
MDHEMLGHVVVDPSISCWLAHFASLSLAQNLTRLALLDLKASTPVSAHGEGSCPR